MKLFTAWLAGLIFAVGLGISQMTDPAKVIAFLDVSGAWDPSLAFVMGGAIGVHVFAARWMLRRKAPLLESSFHLPKTQRIDVSVLVGSALFGIGWGIAGYCPGPALVASVGLGSAPLSFIASMLIAMAAVRWARAAICEWQARRAAPERAELG